MSGRPPIFGWANLLCSRCHCRHLLIVAEVISWRRSLHEEDLQKNDGSRRPYHPTSVSSSHHRPCGHDTMLHTHAMMSDGRERGAGSPSASCSAYIEGYIFSSDAQTPYVCNISSRTPRARASRPHRVCHRLLCWYGIFLSQTSAEHCRHQI